MKPRPQKDPYESPWGAGAKLRMVLWEWCWLLFCAWTPKPLNRWRLFWLGLFGARIEGLPFVHQRARIAIPWHLVLEDRACLSDRTNVYSLGTIRVRARATVAQEVYLCAGTHDFADPALPLVTAEIEVGEDSFIGARAFILPGLKIGKKAVVGACAVVTKDVPEGMIVAGNPARVLGPRNREGQ